MLGLSQFHGWVGQDLSRAMQSIETVEKSEREREGKQLKDQEKERPNWRILCFVKGREVWGKQGVCFLWGLSDMTSALWGRGHTHNKLQ